MNYASSNKQYAGQTLDWLPMDTEELYKFNLKSRYNELESNRWIDKIRPKIIVFALPVNTRIELIVNGHAEFLSPAWNSSDRYSNYLKDWIADDNNANLNRLKNKLAVKSLCQDRGIKYIEIDPYDILVTEKITPKTLARDLAHPGIGYHKRVSEIVLQLISS